ncbi:MAG: SHOCT domain-containing protein [Candidatus Neomarinimicrobiota bacterium]
MKYLRPVLMLLVAAATVEAATPGGGPHRRGGHGRWRTPHVVRLGAAFHYPAYSYATPFWGHAYLYPAPGARGEWELADSDAIIKQIEKLHVLKEQGILTDREYRRAKRTLLDRLGQYVPRKDDPKDTAEVARRLEQLHALKVKGLIDEGEYAWEKRKLLRLI